MVSMRLFVDVGVQLIGQISGRFGHAHSRSRWLSWLGVLLGFVYRGMNAGLLESSVWKKYVREIRCPVDDCLQTAACETAGRPRCQACFRFWQAQVIADMHFWTCCLTSRSFEKVSDTCAAAKIVACNLQATLKRSDLIESLDALAGRRRIALKVVDAFFLNEQETQTGLEVLRAFADHRTADYPEIDISEYDFDPLAKDYNDTVVISCEVEFPYS